MGKKQANMRKLEIFIDDNLDELYQNYISGGLLDKSRISSNSKSKDSKSYYVKRLQKKNSM